MFASPNTALPAEDNASRPVIVSRREAGLGDGLWCLLCALLMARQTGRRIVVDWRRSPYLRDRGTNLFPRLFEVPERLLGVELSAAPDGNRDHWPLPCFPPPRVTWNPIEVFERWRNLRYGTPEPHRQVLERSLIAGSRTSNAPTIRFETCIAHDVSDELVREFWSELAPREHLVEQQNDFERRHFAGRKVVGVHVRHGNGGWIMGHGARWLDPEATLGAFLSAIEGALERMPGAAIFLCTDSGEIEQRITARFQETLSRSKRFAAQGRGELHLQRWSTLDVAEDALLDMRLLCACDHLIAFPGSFFSAFPLRRCLSSETPAV